MELVDSSFAEVKQSGGEDDINMIVDGFKRHQNKQVEMYKKLYGITAQIELLEARTENRRVDVMQLMEQLSKVQEKNIISKKRKENYEFEMKTKKSKYILS